MKPEHIGHAFQGLAILQLVVMRRKHQKAGACKAPPLASAYECSGQPARVPLATQITARYVLRRNTPEVDPPHRSKSQQTPAATTTSTTQHKICSPPRSTMHMLRMPITFSMGRRLAAAPGPNCHAICGHPRAGKKCRAPTRCSHTPAPRAAARAPHVAAVYNHYLVRRRGEGAARCHRTSPSPPRRRSACAHCYARCASS